MDFRVMVGKNVEPFICTRQWGWPEAKKKHSLNGPTLVFSYTFTRFCALPSMTK